MSAKWMEASRNDLQKLTSSGMHRACENTQTGKSGHCSVGMSKYLFETNGALKIFDAKKVWNKIVLAARIICAVPNEKDVCVVGKGEIYHRALLKFAKYINGSSITGRFSPGTFTNHAQKGFKEPGLIIVANPIEDQQSIREAAHVGIPVIAMCDGDTSLKNIDCAIPCNNKAVHAIGTCWWFLAREVLRLRGELNRAEEWSAVMPDLFFFRSPDEVDKQEKEEEAAAPVVEDAMPEETYQADGAPQWDQPAVGETGEQADWTMDNVVKEGGEELTGWGVPATTEPTNDWATDT